MRYCFALRAAFYASVICLTGEAQARAQEEEDDHARRRWEYFYQQRAFPFGTIPAGALERARLQLQGMIRTSFLDAAPPPVSGTRWQAIGPRAIPISGTSIGRISTVAVHPTNSSLIYIGGAQGGVWRTSDGGVNWTPLTDKECSLAMGSIALDPVNPTIVYAATGEQHFASDSYYGCGVLRSSDGGNTWTRLGATTFVRSRISRLVIVPSTAGTPATTTLLVASDNGLWRSLDGGASWTLVRSGTATDLVLDPTNERTVYVAVRAQGVFRSVDGGSTWSPLGANFPTGTTVGRINLAITPTAPGRLFASVHNTSNSELLGIWITTDAGVSWAQLPATGASCGNQCWYDMFIAVHPANPNTLFFGGVRLYRSLDGGLTFTPIAANIHVDQHNIAFDPQDAQRVYVVNDGGIYRSIDGGNAWTSLNAGLELTQFYGGISLHPSERTVVLGGTQDNGTLRFSNNPTWAAVIGGDGGFTAINYDNPLVQFGETQWTTGSTSSGPRRSDGAGFVRKVNGINTSETALFIPPLVMDPWNPQVLYFATNRLYRTSDAAENWRTVSPQLAPTGAISAIAPASDAATVYIGTNTGLLHVTRDTGTTWVQRNTGLPQRSITDVAVDRGDALTAYVSVSGFGTPHVFRTINGGQSWSNVSGNLPDMPVNAVLLDPASRGMVMIGTDLGVFISADSGGSWSVLDDGMPNVAVFDLAYNPATASLTAATHGRGMFQLQLDRPLTVAVVPRRRKVTVVEGSAATRDSAAVVLTGTGSAAASWSAAAIRTWLTITTATGTGAGRVSWTRNTSGLAPGLYVDTIAITTTGALDSPALLVDSMVVESDIAVLTVAPRTRRDTVSAGTTVLRTDSALISLPGLSGSRTAWTAAASKGNWITVTTAAGTGSGMTRWSRNPAGLNAGVYIDTITINAGTSVGSPGSIVDSLIILPRLTLAAASRRDTLLSGASGTSSVTRQLSIGGDPDGALSWTVSHGAAAWLTLTTTSGRGNGPISWTRSAANLRDGIFVDTITVSAGLARLQVVDTLFVAAPTVSSQCVADHLFGNACLDATQLRWLDLIGNRDGQYNLGDLMAFLARGSTPSAFRPRRR